MKKVLGCLLFSTPLIILLGFMAIVTGLIKALIIFGGSLVFTLFFIYCIYTGLDLLEG
jgi:hypothetical protein